MKKRILSVILAALMLWISLPAGALERGSRFSDVPHSAWYATAVNTLAGKNIIGGMPDGKFYPANQVTRSEFLKMLALVSGKPLNANGIRENFTDVPDSKWFAPYVRWGVKYKVVTGTGNGRFNPDGPITRQEMAVFLWRFNKNTMGKNFPRYQNPFFSDTGHMASWARVEISAVCGAKVMKGYEDRTFRPAQQATRAEAAQIIYQYSTSVSQYPAGIGLDELRFIMHGGGEYLNDHQVSNSLEAINEAHQAKNKLLEIDFSWTTDNQLVCLHNWGGKYPPRSTLASFMGQRIFGRLTPMSLDTFAAWLRAHPDVQVVPDIKERHMDVYAVIAQRYPDLLTRIIPYVYHTWEYEKMLDMGYKTGILICYKMTKEEKANPAGLITFAKSNNLAAVAVSAFTESAFYGVSKGSGMPLLAYVVDSEDLMWEFAKKGADGFVTNRQWVKINW